MRLKIFLLLLFFFQKDFLSATPVSGFNAVYKNGQVFCMWTNLSSSGIEYHLYKSPTPILHGSDLINCQYLGVAYDSSSFNKHLSDVESQPYFLKIDSAGNPLDHTIGLFVTTSQQDGSFYYAIITVSSSIEDTTIVFGENSLSIPVSELVARPKPVYQASVNVNNHMVDVYVLFTSMAATALFPQMISNSSYAFNFALYKNGMVPPHPLTVRLSGGGANFLSSIASGALSNEYRIGLDDWLPNEKNSTWFGYNEQYDIFGHLNSPPVTGINHDYTFERLQYTIDWAIRNLPVDSNSIYFNGVSAGASGCFFASLTKPSRIAAASLRVPKFDLSFLDDPDATNNYNAGMPGRLRVDTLLGTVATNLFTNVGPRTYDLLNGGWLAHEHANDNVPLLFAVNGKRDTMVGWAEKIPYYDSVNANQLGGVYYWDKRKHNGAGQEWIFDPNLFRYHRNVSFPAFSNCSINNDPGDGHANSGDSLGTINGFLDWNDTITDEDDHYQISVFMHDLQTYFTTVVAPDSCFTNITLRRVQNFSVPIGAWIYWKNKHQEQKVQQDSFLYSGGLITLQEVKIFKDTSEIKVSWMIPTGIHHIDNDHPVSFSLYPNPATQEITLDGLLQNSSYASIVITDVVGKEWRSLNMMVSGYHLKANVDVHLFPPGIYFVNVNGRVKSFVKN